MTYDLAVWEGERPSSHEEAGAIHTALYDQYIDTDDELPPTPLLVEFVNVLLERWPDDDEDKIDDVPWAVPPLIDAAAGPYIYFSMSYSWAEEASAHVVQVAHRLGLVCFDPQEDCLLT